MTGRETPFSLPVAPDSSVPTSYCGGSRTIGTPVVNLDLLTYAGNPGQPGRSRIGPALPIRARRHLRSGIVSPHVLREHRPRAIVHFAAESHVDRSIADPEAFIRTNVQGTSRCSSRPSSYWLSSR